MAAERRRTRRRNRRRRSAPPPDRARGESCRVRSPPESDEDGRRNCRCGSGWWCGATEAMKPGSAPRVQARRHGSRHRQEASTIARASRLLSPHPRRLSLSRGSFERACTAQSWLSPISYKVLNRGANNRGSGGTRRAAPHMGVTHHCRAVRQPKRSGPSWRRGCAHGRPGPGLGVSIPAQNRRDSAYPPLLICARTGR